MSARRKSVHLIVNLQSIAQLLAVDAQALNDPAIVREALQSIDRGLAKLRTHMDAAHAIRPVLP